MPRLPSRGVSAEAAIRVAIILALRHAGPQPRPVTPLATTVSGHQALMIRFADNRRRSEHFEGVDYYVPLTQHVFVVAFAYPMDQRAAMASVVQEIMEGVVVRDGGDPARPFLRCEHP
jgi:hypothetical protein